MTCIPRYKVTGDELTFESGLEHSEPVTTKIEPLRDYIPDTSSMPEFSMSCIEDSFTTLCQMIRYSEADFCSELLDNDKYFGWLPYFRCNNRRLVGADINTRYILARSGYEAHLLFNPGTYLENKDQKIMNEYAEYDGLTVRNPFYYLYVDGFEYSIEHSNEPWVIQAWLQRNYKDVDTNYWHKTDEASFMKVPLMFGQYSAHKQAKSLSQYFDEVNKTIAKKWIHFEDVPYKGGRLARQKRTYFYLHMNEVQKTMQSLYKC